MLRIIAFVLGVLIIVSGFVWPYNGAVDFFSRNYTNYGNIFKDGDYKFIIFTYCLLAVVVYRILSTQKRFDDFFKKFCGFALYYIILSFFSYHYYYSIDALLIIGFIIVGYVFFTPIYGLGHIIGNYISTKQAYKEWRDEFERQYLDIKPNADEVKK